MKTVRIKRSGLLLSVVMGVALAGLVTSTGSALAQGAQTGEPPFWKSTLTGSNTPLLDLSEQPGYLQGLSVSGFVNSLTGMWVNSSGIRYQNSKNSLSSARSWLQLDINYILNGQNRFFIRGWVVYEPAYRFEYRGTTPGTFHDGYPGGPGMEDMSD